MGRLIPYFLGSFLAFVLSIPSAFAAPEKANLEAIKAHLWMLSHDELQGRDTGSPGHEIASLYMASHFRQFGLKPAGDNGTYMQRIKFRQSFLDQASPKLSFTDQGETVELSFPKQYIASPSTDYEQAEVQGKLVFVGYGIVAPELKHDDYAGLDVKGKIVVMLSGKPKFFPSEEGAHFASGSQKSHYAVERGAIGIVTLSTPTAESIRPYNRLLNRLHAPSVRWLHDDGTPDHTFPQIKNSAYFSREAAEMLFKNAAQSIESIYAQLEKDEVPKGFEMDVELSMSKSSEFKEITSPNVVALLEGSDPELKKEYVVYSAHTDHIGIAKSVKKDRINNGAMDNASGMAIMLETARLFSQMPRPKRSLLFVAVTGEEKGLLGSSYFASNPTVPVEQIVANINLDMPVLLWDFTDVLAFGSNHSDLANSVGNAANKLGLTLSPDPWPEQAIFTRSDHYNFVKQGIPSVYLMPGLKSKVEGEDGAKLFAGFFRDHYHLPSDEFNDMFNDNAILKFTQVNLLVGEEVANQDKRPAWNKGDFFGDTFSRD